jgi:hypothetical protein
MTPSNGPQSTGANRVGNLQGNLFRRLLLAILTVGLLGYVQVANAAPRPAWPPWPEPTLALYRFDEVDWHPPLLPPAIGFENASVQESWSEYALVRDGLSIAPVAVPVIDSTGRRTLAPDSGAVRFWFSPAWSSVEQGGKGPGGYARLLELVDLSGSTPQTRWSLYLGEAGDTLYLSGVGADAKAMDFLKAGVSFIAGDWQLITLNYSPKGTELWLGDQLVAEGEGLPAPAQGQEPWLGLIIGSDFGVSAPANGQFEELTTFDYWPEPEQLAFYFNGVGRQAFLGPVGSEKEEAAKRELLAAAFPQPLMLEEEEGSWMQMAYSYSTNELWLEIMGVTNDFANLILHNTQPWEAYEIQSKEDLTAEIWLSETNVLGVDGQDWTAVNIPTMERTNALFFRARSYVDDDGDGLPSWWELEHGLDPSNPDTGGTGVSDGYKDDDEDGWSNLQEYQNGTNPIGFNTPPAPQGFSVHINADGDEVTLSWIHQSSAVTNYVIERDWNFELDQFATSLTTWTDGEILLPFEPYWDDETPLYRVRANYPGGASAWSDERYPMETLNPVAARLLSATSQGGLLQAQGVPADAAAIRLTELSFSSVVTNLDIPVASFVNGAAAVPEYVQTNYPQLYWMYQVVRSNGLPSMAWPMPFEPSSSSRPFVDGRQALAENLAFWLRAACAVEPFEFSDSNYNYYAFPQDFVYASFVDVDDYLSVPGAYVEPWLPFEDNYRYRNCVFDVGLLNSEDGWLATGFYQDYWGFGLAGARTYEFTGEETFGQFASLLSEDDTEWLHPGWAGWALGIDGGAPGEPIEMAEEVTNYYGLTFLSAQVVWAGGTNGLINTVLSAGSSVSDLDPSRSHLWFYPQTAQPEFENLGYHFGQMNVDPLPGHSGFTETNATPLMVASVGHSIQVAGYARLAIANGYPDKHAYLGQYFDRAYKANPDGSRSTNETGFLSPYGEFFPTEPGPVILTTMPDGVSTNVGECKVHVVSLSVDANHDGVMDLSLTGDDQTTPARPFRFWINNDHDEPAGGSSPDQDLNNWGDPPPVPSDYTSGAIRCQRNLEDFGRLWICGIPTLPPDYTVQLEWSSIPSGSPRVRVYWASETNGSIGYLTNTSVAGQQIAQYNTPIAEISWNNPLILPANVFSNGVTKHLLFEAGAVGSGELTMTISQGGTNIIAQASQWFEFHDIIELYEQALVTNVFGIWPDMVQTNLTSGFQVLSHAIVNPGSGKQVAVFIHGWRMGAWDYYNFSATMLKRLWWQGYQGRFAALRWPTRNANTELFPQMGYITYNRSEHIAFKSGTGAADYLTNLRDRFPDHTISGCAHSMGGIVMMQALKELASASQQPSDNWVLMQAAVPAQCFDTNAPDFQLFLDGEAVVPTPDVYRNYAVGLTNALRPGGQIANFFNPDDFALQIWRLNQAFYVENLLGNGVTTMKPNAFFGYSTDGTNSLLSTNVWNQSLYSVIYAGYYGNGPTRAITDPLELMPFVARPRSLAVGAQPNVYGQIQGQQLNLETQLGFGASAGDHSGEFNRNIQEPPIWPFFSQLLTNLFPQQ